MDKKEEDKKYIHDLYQQYKQYVYTVIKNSIASDYEYEIEDCLQEVFIVAFIKIDYLRGIDYQKAWLAKTSRNIVMNFNAKKKRQNVALDDGSMLNQIIMDESLENIVIDKIDQDIISNLNISKILEQELKEDEKKLYYLKYKLGFPNEKIGEILEISSKAVNARAGRLKKKIKKIIHKKMNQ